MSEGKELPDKQEKKESPGLMETAKASFFHLLSRKKEIDDKYDQSIAAIKDWEAEQNKKLDAIEEQLKLRYDGTVIDVALMEQQAELECCRQHMLEKQKHDLEDYEALSNEIKEFLKGNSK